MTINMGGESYNIAQKSNPTSETQAEKIARGKALLRKERSDDPDGNLGMTIRMDGETLSVA